MFLLLYPFIFALASGLTKISSEESQRIQKECAVSKRRVLNGNRVSTGELKYVVNVLVGTDSKMGVSRCAGTLISSRHVLTAAHCFTKKNGCSKKAPLKAKKVFKKATTYVYFGGQCIVVGAEGKCEEGKKNSKVLAKTVVVPGLYLSSNCSSGDLAIIELSQPVESLSNNTDTACLPLKNTVLASEMFSAGYGSDPNNAIAQEKYLEMANFTSDRYCDPSLNAGKDAFCTQESRQFMCRGDSGSGVMQSMGNCKKDYVMGVLHGGLLCSLVKEHIESTVASDKEFRGSVNTDVRRYLGWICAHTSVCPIGVEPSPHIKKKTIKVM